MCGARVRVIAKRAGHEPVLDWLSEALLGVTSNSKTGYATSRVGNARQNRNGTKWFYLAGEIGERAAGVWVWETAARGMGNELTGDAGATVGGVGHSGDLVGGHQVGIALDGELED
jgi:hypothetical protein